MIVSITTCKGRLSHLKKTLPAFVKEFDRCVVVDWGCPDKSGEWAINNGASALWAGTDTDRFHKTKALNLGAELALKLGATRLVFLDADTILIKSISGHLLGLGDKLIALTGVKRGEPVHNGKPSWRSSKANVIGFLSCSAGAFQSINGFDENFISWGYEDLDMRLRLIADAGCKPVWIDETCFAAIVHPNELRMQFQPDTLVESNKRNGDRYRAKLRNRLEYWSQDLKDALPFK